MHGTPASASNTTPRRWYSAITPGVFGGTSVSAVTGDLPSVGGRGALADGAQCQ